MGKFKRLPCLILDGNLKENFGKEISASVYLVRKENSCFNT